MALHVQWGSFANVISWVDLMFFHPWPFWKSWKSLWCSFGKGTDLPGQAMKAWGWGCIEVEWRSLYSWQQGFLCPFNEAGQASAPVLMFWRKEKFLAPARSEIFHLRTLPLSFYCAVCLADVEGSAFTQNLVISHLLNPFCPRPAWECCMSWLVADMLLVGMFGKFWKTICYVMSLHLLFCPHGTTWLLVDAVS